MRSLLVVLIAAGLVTAAEKPSDEAVRKTLQKMQGTWKVIQEESEGQVATKEMNKEADVRLVIKGDTYAVSFGGNRVVAGKLKVDPTQKPMAMDDTATEGTSKGQTMRGIFELKGDELKSCLANPGKERPKEFSAKKGAGRYYIIYQRVKR
jgi:uncharacterized protein (TIGR03067 family)